MKKRNLPRKREYLPELPTGAKPIPGFDSYYVSPEGLVLSETTKGYLIRRSVVGKDGYARVILSLGNQKITTKYVHRLVAEAFVPGYEPGLTVTHKNLDKTDNRISNLEWISFRDNLAHWRNTNPEAAKRAQALTGTKVSRPVIAVDPSNGTTYDFQSVKSAALWANGDPGNISRAAKSGKQAYMMLWKYMKRRKRHNPLNNNT